MNPFYEGELRHFTEKLRSECFPHGVPSLPQVLGERGEVGSAARSLITELAVADQEVLANFCTKRLSDPRWIRSQHNQEVAKVVLDEVSISAVGAAQELGLALSSALGRVDAPWMRILVSLTLSELLSRTHVYAPSCAVAYIQTFRSFDRYLERHEYTCGQRDSLFDPIALAHGELSQARIEAIKSVLPYGEDALRLLWGLQARDLDQGNLISAKIFRGEEEELAGRLESWRSIFERNGRNTECRWHSDLREALLRSRSGTGPDYVRLLDTSRSRAVGPLLQDIESMMSLGNIDEAHHSLSILRAALASDRDLEFTTLKNHHLHSSYLDARVTYRLHSNPCSERLGKEKVRGIWRVAEREFNEPGSLWPKSVTNARRAALNEIPREWRFTPTPCSI